MTIQALPVMDDRLGFDLADRLRRALRVSEVSVQDMADYLGVTRGTVSAWINGRIEPNMRTMRLFALKTGFPLDWLEAGECTPRDLNPEPTDSGSLGRVTPIRRPIDEECA